MYYGTVEDDDSQWAPVSDLMAVLMLVFMFIAVIFIHTIINKKEVFKEECDKIYQALETKFKDDFNHWQVDLLTDLTIRFRNPDILFETGSDEIPSRFRNILSSFFPRYLDSIYKFEKDIREIRIEGHASSEYKGAESVEAAYFLNMSLSQDRAHAVLHHVLSLPDASGYAEWARTLITANGLSFSRLIKDSNDKENKKKSRRVEFRLLASSCQKAGVYENQNQ